MSGPEALGLLRAMPWGLVGMLALSLAVERFAARHEHDLFLKFDAWSWQRTGQYARTEAPKSRILCFGDSQVQRGVIAPILESRTGRPTFNLALGGGQAVSSYVLLRRALEAGARPDALLVDFFPGLLAGEPLAPLDAWAPIADYADALDLAVAGRDPDIFTEVALAKLLPTYRERHAIRGNLTSALLGEDHADRHVVPPFVRRNMRLNRGAFLCPDPPEPKGDLEAEGRKHFKDDWACHPLNARYLERFMELAASREIPVFWLILPIDPGLQRISERTGVDAKHLAFAREIQARFSNVTVLDGRASGYGPSAFFDHHHLGVRGASVFTDDVAAVVRRALDGDRPFPRWVKLSEYRERPIDVPLEDIEQSRLALKREREARRR